MRIDLTPLLDGRQQELNVEYAYTPGEDGVLLPDGIRLREPIHVRCNITDNHGYTTLVASATAHYDTVCDRCLDPISTSLTFSINRLVDTGAGIRPEEGEDDDDFEDSLLAMNGGAIDIDNEITEAFVLELPMYHLCREDCPGLCPRCGKRLADGDCGCSAKKEIDPRLAILQKLLEKPE